MNLNPELTVMLEELNAIGRLDLGRVTPADLRSQINLPKPGIREPVGNVDDREIDGPECRMDLRIYQPKGAGPFPLMAFFHGGGFVLGDLDSHDGVCRSLCNAIGCIVVSVDYRLAPEAPFPAAPEDCYAATKWCAENAHSLGGNGERLLVAGDSAGGCLAAAVTQMARDRGGPSISHQLLMYPATDINFERYSYLRYGEGYFLTRALMKWCWQHYLKTDDAARNHYAVPFRCERFAGLPSATVITAGFDPLKDEGRAYYENLIAHGVDATHCGFDEMIHGFLSLPVPLRNSKDQFHRIATVVKKYLRAENDTFETRPGSLGHADVHADAHDA